MRIRLPLITLCILLAPLIFAGNKATKKELTSGLFGSEETLIIVLTTDLKQLLRNTKDEAYLEGEFTLLNKTYPIRLKARGNYRRENCGFPPITFNFSKTEFEDKSYDQLKELKLVTACEMQKSFQQYILREYLIYKTFNILSDKSFKARLVKIDFVDSKEKIQGVTRYGFVIEDQYIMAKRLNGIIIKKTGINDQSTNREQTVMLSIFQFMLGNTDWQIPRLHNVTLVKQSNINDPSPFAIPFDFDYSGMVDASYAIPSPILGIKTVRERLYWGKCYTEQELKTAINKFLAKKDTIYTLYENFELFDNNSLSSSMEYLNSFYKIIEDEKKWEDEFINNCRDK